MALCFPGAYLPQSHPSSLPLNSLSHPLPTAANQHKSCPLLFSSSVWLPGHPIDWSHRQLLDTNWHYKPKMQSLHSTHFTFHWQQPCVQWPAAACHLTSHTWDWSRCWDAAPPAAQHSHWFIQNEVKIVTFHPPVTLSVIYSPNLFLHLKPQVKQTHLHYK